MAFDWKAGLPGIAGVGAGIAGMFGGGGGDFQNPADAAMPYLNKIPGTLDPYFRPYIERGGRAGDTLEGQYGSMTRDPAGFLAGIGKNYQQSPGYQWRLNQAMQGSNNASAAGGMLGSPANQQQNATVAEGLANQDYDTWLNHALDAFNNGQSGYENFYNKGYGASTNYGEDLARALESQASFAAQGASEQNKYNQAEQKSDSDMWGNILGGIGGIAGAFMGGPPGAMAGSSIGSAAGSAAAGL